MRKVFFNRARTRRASKKHKLKKPPLTAKLPVITAKLPVIKKEELRKGIYIIPSLFTCGNITFGLLSIFSSVAGDFLQAAWYLIGALACDIIDGRVARMTRTTSDFGIQLDSLGDLVSFGVAPAVMMYMLVLNTMGKIGISIAVLFVLCSALRLARFNVLTQAGQVRKHFVGLPTPASAGVIISFVLSYHLLAPEDYMLNFKSIPVLMELMPSFFKAMPIVIVVLSFLMVSNIPYMSFKKIKFSKVRTLQLFSFVIVLIILIVVYPQNIIFIIFSVYAASGLLFYVPGILLKNKKRAKLIKAEEDED
jgi:CDP-diacylglycerol--serine O-phosphatidyltransferase